MEVYQLKGQDNNYLQLNFFYNQATFFEDTIKIDKAFKRWESAQRFFDSITDESLLDYAIIELDAAKRNYTFLLNRAKERISLDLQ